MEASDMHSRRAFMSAVIAIVAISAVAAGCGSSGAQPAAHGAATRSPTATPPAVAQHTFASRRYGFRVTLTRAWSETDAQVGWKGHRLQGLASPAFANFDDEATGRSLAVGAAPVASGMKLAEWAA